MKLVMLPGMDGTGKLFAPILPRITCSALVIELPQNGAQDYDTLTDYVLSQLPDEDFVLLAESFSGPIAANIASSPPPQLKGLIFVATFISPPAFSLLKIAKRLPIKRLSSLPLSSLVIRAILMGRGTSRELLASFLGVVDSVPEKVLRDRIAAIEQLKTVTSGSDIPALYIQASQDRLVSADKAQEFESLFSNLAIAQIDGPHFILQARREECAALINRF